METEVADLRLKLATVQSKNIVLSNREIRLLRYNSEAQKAVNYRTAVWRSCHVAGKHNTEVAVFTTALQLWKHPRNVIQPEKEMFTTD